MCLSTLSFGGSFFGWTEHFGYCSLFLENNIFFLEMLHRYFCYYSNNHKKINMKCCLFRARPFWGDFCPIFFRTFFQKPSIFSWCFASIYLVLLWLSLSKEQLLRFSFCFGQFGVIIVHFWACSSKSSELFNIDVNFYVIFLFWKNKQL